MTDTKHPAEALADAIERGRDVWPVRDAVAMLRRIPALEAEIAAWRRQCDTLTHQVITCGVAAHHPDPSLTTRGAYAGKWNSPQAEDVRKLRSERDQLRAALDEAQAEASVAQMAVEALRADAERYRWLRRWKGQEHEPPFTVQHELDGTLWGGDLDDAIDAAREAK